MSQLLQEAVEKLGLEFFCVHVADANTAAKKVYKHFDFNEAVMSPEELTVWTDRDEKVLRMEVGIKR